MLNGFINNAETGILKVATSRMTSNPLLALEKIELPAKQIPVHSIRTMVPQRYCHQNPSSRKLAQVPDSDPKFWVKQSIRPTAFIPVFKTYPR